MSLILASGSPRRLSLLREAGYQFIVVPADIDESRVAPGRPAEEAALLIALAKARFVAAKYPNDVILAADTIVALENEILGKPTGAGDARKMLNALGGSIHRVIGGVVVLRLDPVLELREFVTSTVQMRRLSEIEIATYLATGQWEGKAGGYGIQDADPFVTRVEGCATNIVGLPMTTTARLLASAGIFPA